MNWVDYVVLGTLLLSTLVGIVRGATREVLGLAAWLLAFVLAYLLADQVAQSLARWIDDPALRLLAAYALVFIVVLAVGAVVTALLAGWIRDTALSGADRTLGAGFGLARAVVLIGAGVLLSDLADARDSAWWQESVLVIHFEGVGRALAALLPDGWIEALRPEPIQAPSQSQF